MERERGEVGEEREWGDGEGRKRVGPNALSLLPEHCVGWFSLSLGHFVCSFSEAAMDDDENDNNIEDDDDDDDDGHWGGPQGFGGFGGQGLVGLGGGGGGQGAMPGEWWTFVVDFSGWELGWGVFITRQYPHLAQFVSCPQTFHKHGKGCILVKLVLLD